VRFPVSTSFKAGKEAEQIVSDKNTGSYLYNEQGDYIYEEQQTEASKEKQNEKTTENTNNGNSGESSKEENTGDNNTEEKNTAQAGVEEESRTGDRGDVKQGESQQLSDVTEADTTDGGRNTWMIFLVALAVIAEIAVVLFLRKKHL
jgi:cobalamin biosynthesis Mg chelatase CobN